MIIRAWSGARPQLRYMVDNFDQVWRFERHYTVESMAGVGKLAYWSLGTNTDLPVTFTYTLSVSMRTPCM